MMPPLVRGTQDLWIEAFQQHAFILDAGRRCAQAWGFSQIDLPILEHASLFSRSAGDESDIVLKEMYTVSSAHSKEDRKDALVLRPEGTAQVMRALYQKGVQTQTKVFYCGPMFRHDRPQKGRLRQFHQLGVEHIHAKGWRSDVDLILLSQAFLKTLGISATLHINTLGSDQDRCEYHKPFTAFLHKNLSEFSALTQEKIRRHAGLRVWDSKNAIDLEILKGAPTLQDCLSQASLQRFQNITQELTHLNVPYHHNTTLVRGLDYYTHTVFEWKSDNLGAQNTILAGGCYDNLMASLTQSKHTATALGWAAGIERLVLAAGQNSSHTTPDLRWGVTFTDRGSAQDAWPVIQALRDTLHYTIHIALDEDTLGKRLKNLQKFQVDYSILIDSSQITLKNMTSGHQDVCPDISYLFTYMSDYSKNSGKRAHIPHNARIK